MNGRFYYTKDEDTIWAHATFHAAPNLTVTGADMVLATPFLKAGKIILKQLLHALSR